MPGNHLNHKPLAAITLISENSSRPQEGATVIPQNADCEQVDDLVLLEKNNFKWLLKNSIGHFTAKFDY